MIIHLAHGTTYKKLRYIDEEFSNLLKKLEREGFSEELLFSCFYHKVALVTAIDLFEKYEEEIPRREALNSIMKIVRKIYNMKYKEFEEFKRR
jgi:hypothetical protein